MAKVKEGASQGRFKAKFPVRLQITGGIIFVILFIIVIAASVSANTTLAMLSWILFIIGIVVLSWVAISWRKRHP